MKKIILILSLFVSFQTLACRPDIYSIQHNLAIKALEQVFKQTRLSTADLVSSEMVDFDMAWISTNSGYQCPDFYSQVLNLQYKTKKIKVTINSKDEEVQIEEI